MNKRFSYDNITKSHSINPNDLIRVYKLDRCCDFMEEKYNNPSLTQKQICKKLGFSDSTIKRFRDDIQMDSPYRRNNLKKKTNNKSNTSVSQPQSNPQSTNESPKNKIIEKRIKNKPKNEIKGGNISDIHAISGKELIDQAFESDKANSILENKQEDNTKFITIARRMIDNK